jgi:hypothetical protein
MSLDSRLKQTQKDNSDEEREVVKERSIGK